MRKPSIAKTLAKNKARKTMPGMKAMAPMMPSSKAKAMAPMMPTMKNGGSAKKPKMGIAIVIAVGKKGKK